MPLRRRVWPGGRARPDLLQGQCPVRLAASTLCCAGGSVGDTELRVPFADSALAALKLSPGPLQVPLYKRAGEQQAPPCASTPCPKLGPGTP